MKSIAFLICSETVGGHEFQSMELAVSTKGFAEVHVIFNSLAQAQKLIPMIAPFNISFEISGKRFFRGRNFILQYFYGFLNCIWLRQKVKIYDKIIVCAGTPEAGISAGVGLLFKEIMLYVPMFVDRSLLWGPIGMVYNLISQLFILPYQGIITLNRYQASAFKIKKVFIVPNIIQRSDHPVIEREGSGKLYFVGRLERQKRIPELIKWLDHPENPYKEFIIIGEGREEDVISKMEYDLKHISIQRMGWLDTKRQNDVISSKDVCVLNSAYEGDPLVIREANDRGSIVLARDILGVKGCTLEQNRFKSEKELLTLLQLAYKNQLSRYVNESIDAVNEERNHAISQIVI